MTELDRETQAVIDALVYRLRNRAEGTDDEPFAMEFVQALLGRGWRPTEARKAPAWNSQRSGGTGPTEEFLAAKAALADRLAKPGSAA